MPVKSSPTNSMQKTCRVLCALSDPRVRRLSDIAEATQINKVSVLRILDALVAEGLVGREASTKEYRFGPEAYVISSSLTSEIVLRRVARPSLSRLAEATGDTVLLVAKAGLACVCLERETGSFPIHASTLMVGSRRALGIGSGPLAVLSWLDPGERDAALQHVKPSLRHYPGLSERRLREAIRETRDRGYAMVIGEVQPEIGAISMVIPDDQGRPLGAVSISSLRERIRSREDWLVQQLSREIAAIRSLLRKAPGAA